MATDQKAHSKLHITLDFRVISALLLVIIVAMLLLWRPWSAMNADDRTISVTGEATVAAEPDEYVFSPSYSFESGDQQALSQKNEEVVQGLKDLGVEDKDIKNNSSDYDLPVYREGGSSSETLTLRLTITVNNKELAGKVQNYLLDTSPTGAITPQYTFSNAKRDQLQAQARDEATNDARAKAEQSANNLGFKLGKVKEVTDGSGFGVLPLRGDSTTTAQDTVELSLQPGENELNYSVSVVYYLR